MGAALQFTIAYEPEARLVTGNCPGKSISQEMFPATDPLLALTATTEGLSVIVLVNGSATGPCRSSWPPSGMFTEFAEVAVPVIFTVMFGGGEGDDTPGDVTTAFGGLPLSVTCCADDGVDGLLGDEKFATRFEPAIDDSPIDLVPDMKMPPAIRIKATAPPIIHGARPLRISERGGRSPSDGGGIAEAASISSFDETRWDRPFTHSARSARSIRDVRASCASTQD